MRDDSICKRAILCDFRRVFESDRGIVEVCNECGKEVKYEKRSSGNIDEEQYEIDHYRDYLQPWGSTAQLYYEIYGFDTVRKIMKKYKRKSKEQDRKEWEEIGKEAKDYVNKRISSGTGGTDWT